MLGCFWQYSGVTKRGKTQLIIKILYSWVYDYCDFLWFKRGLQETDRKHSKSYFGSDVITGESASKS